MEKREINRQIQFKMHDLKAIEERAEQAVTLLGNRWLCPRRCGVNRPAGQVGFCGTGFSARFFWREVPIIIETLNLGELFPSTDGCMFVDTLHAFHEKFHKKADFRYVKIFRRQAGCEFEAAFFFS